MALKTVEWLVKCALPCARCIPANVIIVLKNSAQIKQKLSPIQPKVLPETSTNTNYPFTTIRGQLIQIYPKVKTNCKTPYAYSHVLRYDDSQLINSYSLLPADIDSVTCETPVTKFVEESTGNECKLELKHGTSSTYIFTNQHGSTFEFSSSGGGSGSQGPQGATGPQGPQGAQGAAGGGGGGSPTLACGLVYTGGGDLKVNTSGAWGASQLNFPGSETGGGEIFCDSSGKIRTLPPTVATSAQAAFVGSGGLPPTLLNFFNNPSINRAMVVLVAGNYNFNYSNFGLGGGGPLVSVATDGGPLTVTAQALATFSPGVPFGGDQSFPDSAVYSVPPASSLNVTRQVQMVKVNSNDVVHNYSVGLRGIGVAA
jgi:hypothetical protein